jgi:MFS family permease
MGILFLTSMFLSALTIFPMIAGNLAKQMGRPFLTWFIIGFFLPVVSVFILFLLPDKSKKKEQATQSDTVH